MGKSNSSFYASVTPNQNTGFIDPRNIADITVLKGLVATNRYGSAGANGVLLISTKTATVAKVDKKKDLALLTNNIYDGRIRSNDKSLITGYLKALQKGKNVGESYDIYLKQRAAHLNNYAYFIDVFDYFREASPELALRILTNILEIESPIYAGLRALRFKARQLGEAGLESQTAQRILQSFPERIDAYLDLALANQSAGNHQAALDILVGMNSGNINTDLDFTPIRKSVERELRNLVYRQEGELDLAKLPQQYRNNIRYNARIIFSWNQPEAEFGLQFVNPQKRFFTWEHTRAENSQRLRQETEQGFSIEEFEIFGEGVAGDWILNVNYLGNGRIDTTSPVFLSCRVEYNFGKPGQHTEEYVIRLHEPGSESQLAKIRLE
jgi:TonB-dependent SusC/RagA subfamily outer membrane receptor